MNIIQEARDALALIEQGRTALQAIADAVKGGEVAVTSTDQSQLSTMLEQSRLASQQAHDTLQNAINAARVQAN